MKNYLARFRFGFAVDLKTFDEISFFCDTHVARLTKNIVENFAGAARDFSLTTIANIQSALQKKFCAERRKRTLERPESIKNERIGAR